MRAAVYRGVGDVRTEEIPRPECGAGEIVVRIACCGVCWTDLKKIDHGTVPPPRVFGHEMAGVVAEVGAGAPFHPGERVQVYHHVPCRACRYCSSRAYAQCEGYKKTGATAGFEPAGGGFAEYVRVLPWIVFGGGVTRVPEGVSLEAASFLEPVNTCLKCVRTTRLDRGDSVLIVGAGAIGLILARICVLFGADVFVSEPMADRRERAKASGAKDVCDPRTTDVSRWLRDATSGRGADAAIVAVPGQAPFDAALAGVRPGGRIVLFAATKLDDPLTVDAGQVCYLEKAVVGAYSADADLNDEVAELVFSGRLEVADLVTHRFDLADAAKAFELAKSPTAGSLKVLVTTGISA